MTGFQDDTRKDVFDWSNIHEFAEGDKKMEGLLLKIFMDNLERDLEALENNLAEGNHKGWDWSVHKIYGSCAHMGAVSMAEACEKAQSIPSGNESRALMKEMHKSILQEYAKVRSVLEGHCAVF